MTDYINQLTDHEKDLWMEEYRRCRNSGDPVKTACLTADVAVQEISKRMGKKPVLADSIHRWDGTCLDVLVNGGWEFAASANLHGEWFTYTPSSMGGRLNRSGKVDGASCDTEEEVQALAKNAAILALDWESYGLKRPEGI